MALSKLIFIRSSPALSRKLEWIISRGPFQPKFLLILWEQKEALAGMYCSGISYYRNYNPNKKDLTKAPKDYSYL